MANFLSELDKRAEDAKHAADELREAVRSFQSWTNTAGKEADEIRKKLLLLSESVNNAYLSIEKLASEANSRLDTVVSEIKAMAGEHLNDMQNRLTQLADDVNITNLSLDESVKRNTNQLKNALEEMKKNYDCALEKLQKAMVIKVNRIVACVAFAAGILSVLIFFATYLFLK